MLCDALLLEASGFRLDGRSADGCLLHGFDCFHDGLGTPSQAVDLAHAGFRFARLVFVEGGVDAAQNRARGNACFAPGFDQRPVQRGEQQDRAAAALEVLFNLREVVDVVVLHLRS